jgi:hypothetical protein
MVKGVTAVLACVALLILAIVFVPACGTSSSNSGESGASTLMMGYVPKEFAVSGYVFLDIAAMRDDFAGMYTGYQEAFRLLGDYGIDFDDIDRLANAGLALFLLEGGFDLPRIREELGIRDYVTREYLGVEVWESNAIDFKDWVAFVDGMILAGYKNNVVNCIEVMVDGKDSLYVHDDIRGVMDRLPNGLDVFVAALELRNPLLAHGESLERIDESTMKLTVVHKYVDEQAAQDGANKIAQDMQQLLSDALQEVQVQQQDQFVRLTAEVAPEVICARI